MTSQRPELASGRKAGSRINGKGQGLPAGDLSWLGVIGCLWGHSGSLSVEKPGWGNTGS